MSGFPTVFVLRACMLIFIAFDSIKQGTEKVKQRH